MRVCVCVCVCEGGGGGRGCKIGWVGLRNKQISILLIFIAQDTEYPDKYFSYFSTKTYAVYVH